MKLLMITRKIDKNDDRIGFVVDWVNKLASQLDFLLVLCWQPSNPPGVASNVEIINLTAKNKLKKILEFEHKIWSLKKQIDGIFCHMNPEYTILARLFYRGKIVSWYTHGTVSTRMWLMEKLANKILTASKESFRLFSPKVVVTGHGINVEKFQPIFQSRSSEVWRLLTVGRISPTKDYESMIKAIDILVDKGIDKVILTIIGAPGLPKHQPYFESLKQMVKKMNLEQKVKFLGAVPHFQIPHYLQQTDIFLNLSGTGSLDKAVLEAMACGCLLLTSNEAFVEVLPVELMIEKNNPQQLARKIQQLMELPEEKIKQLKQQLRQEIVTNHNLDNLIKKIIVQFSSS